MPLTRRLTAIFPPSSSIISLKEPKSKKRSDWREIISVFAHSSVRASNAFLSAISSASPTWKP
ncbi:MAG: hypothetical protein ACD_87C00100G0001, partial [uncultured bacterium]